MEKSEESWQWARKEWAEREVAVRIMEIKRFSFVLLRKRIPKDLRSLWRVPQ